MTTDPAKLIKFLSLQSLISNGQHVSSSYIQQRDRWSSVNDTLVAASNMKYSHIHDNGNIYCGPVICTFWHIQTKFLLSYSVMNSIYSMLRRKPQNVSIRLHSTPTNDCFTRPQTKNVGQLIMWILGNDGFFAPTQVCLKENGLCPIAEFTSPWLNCAHPSNLY